MDRPRLSVVIPAYNRRELLHKNLDSLARIYHQPGEMEVIVVDDGSQDDTEETVTRREDSFPLCLLRNEKPKGPAAARNQGAFVARGEILGFLDSDVWVQPDWWQAAKSGFADPQVAVVEGATLPPPGSPRPTPFSHYVSNQRGNSFQTCNLFCRRSVFMEVQGFDERFCWQGAGGRLWHVREDTDLAFSILSRGYKIIFEPRAVVLHPILPASRAVHFRKTYLGPSEALLRRKHPKLYRQYLSWIDGRAFPVFYWGVFLGLPILLGGLVLKAWMAVLLGLGLYLPGWAGSVYAVCRKRQVRLRDLAYLLLQYIMIPWMRLYWVLWGEWKFRQVKPEMSKSSYAKSPNRNTPQ